MNRDIAYRYPRAFVIAMFSLIAVFGVLFLSDTDGQQANVFFLKTADYMADLYNPIAYSQNLDFYHYGAVDPRPDEHAYPPLAYFVLYPLSTVAGPHAMAAAVAAFFWFIVCAIFFVFLYDSFEGPKHLKFLIALSMMLSGVFILSFERGNLAILTATLCGFFCLNFNRPGQRVRELALIALALAIGLKGYPALLGLLLLFDRRYREALRLAAYGLAVVFLPFLFVKGGLANVPVWFRNIGLNTDAYEFRDFPRFGFRYFLSYIPDFSPGMTIYTVLKATDLLLILTAVATAVFHRTRWKTITQLLLCIVLFPVNSALYAGTYLFVGIIVFLNDKDHRRLDWLFMALMVLILSPVQFTLGSGLSVNLVIANLAAYTLLILLTFQSARAGWKWLEATNTRQPGVMRPERLPTEVTSG